MRKIIYNAITLLFGQIENFVVRQNYGDIFRVAENLTRTNVTNLLHTIRVVFITIRRKNNLQPEESRMSIKSLVLEFTRVLWHKFVAFLKNTELGKLVNDYIWGKLFFTTGNMLKCATFGVAIYICWRYWDKRYVIPCALKRAVLND